MEIIQFSSVSSANLRIFVSFCPRLWPATCSSSFAAGIREGCTVTQTITSHVLRASRVMSTASSYLFILKHKCYSVYMRLSGVFQRLFKIKKQTCSFWDARTADCSLKLKKYVLARRMTNIGDRHQILANWHVQLPFHANILVLIMFEFHSWKLWLLVCFHCSSFLILREKSESKTAQYVWAMAVLQLAPTGKACNPLF